MIDPETGSNDHKGIKYIRILPKNTKLVHIYN